MTAERGRARTGWSCRGHERDHSHPEMRRVGALRDDGGSAIYRFAPEAAHAHGRMDADEAVGGEDQTGACDDRRREWERGRWGEGETGHRCRVSHSPSL